MATTLADLTIKVRADAGTLNSDLQKVTRSTDRMEKGTRRASRSFTDLDRRTRVLSRSVSGLGLGLGAAGLAMQMRQAVSAAVEFEAATVRLNTLVGIAEDQAQEWARQIRGLSRELGVSAQGMNEAMFAITSGGARGAEAMEILEQSAKASAIGLGDMTSIGRLAGAAVTAFADQNLTASEAIDVMVATVRAGNLEAEALSGSLGRVMGTAAAVGATFQDVGAFVATFTKLGVSARIATTSLQQALNLAIRPAEQARVAMAEAGFSVEDFRAAIQDDGLTSALLQLVEAADGNIDTLGQFIPSVEAMSGILGTAGVQGREFEQIVRDINEAVGTTDESFQRWGETGGASIGRISASFKELKQVAGDTALPGVASGMDDLVLQLDVASMRFRDLEQVGAKALIGIAFRAEDAREALKLVLEEQERLQEMARIAADPGPMRSGRLGGLLAGIEDDIARERERQAKAEAERREAAEAAAAAEQARLTTLKEQADLLSSALDLDVRQSGILERASAIRDEINAALDAGVESLEREVELLRAAVQLSEALAASAAERRRASLFDPANTRAPGSPGVSDPGTVTKPDIVSRIRSRQFTGFFARREAARRAAAGGGGTDFAQFDQATRAVAGLADAAGGLDESARRTIRGISDLVGGIEQIRSGSGQFEQLLGGAGVFAGAVNVISGLIGSTDENTRALQEASRAIRDMQSTISGAVALERMRLEALDIEDPGAQFEALRESLANQVEGLFAEEIRALSTESIGDFLAGIIEFIQSGGQKAEIFAKSLGAEGLSLDELLSVLAEMERLGDATSRVADEMSELGKILNAPQGFKVGLRRFQASDPEEFIGGGGRDLTDFPDVRDVRDRDHRSLDFPNLIVQVDGRTLFEILDEEAERDANTGTITVRPTTRRR